MEHGIILYLSSITQWQCSILVVILPTAVVLLLGYILRVKVGFERLSVNNEVAGFKFAVVGLIYGLLLTLAAISTWDKFSEAHNAVLAEAGAVNTMWHLSDGPDEPSRNIRDGLLNYAKLVVNDEWPVMATERESKKVSMALAGLYTALNDYVDNNSRPYAKSIQMMLSLKEITKARQTRVHLAGGIIPNDLWNVIFFGAILTIGFALFFATENVLAQLLMTGILCIMVFMTISVVISFNHPFTGPVHVGSEVIEHLIKEFEHT